MNGPDLSDPDPSHPDPSGLGSDMSGLDDSFLFGTVEQSAEVDAPIDTVWRAFADLPFRDRWFTMLGERSTRSHELDFRVGGLEVTRSTLYNVDHEERLEHRARFVDLVERRRITTTFEFFLNDVLRIAALTTMSFTDGFGHPASGATTHVDYVEQYQCFGVVGDGSAERGERRGAATFLLRRLKIAVEAAV